MASLNSVILMGNLTRDPELRTTPSGTSVASFGLAVNRRYRQGDEQKEEVMFVDISCFGRQAETACEYLSKGNLVMIEGRLQWRSWETEDGQKRSKHEVVANNIQFMPRGQTDGQQRPTVSSYDPRPEVNPTPVQATRSETDAAMPATPESWPPGHRQSDQGGMFGDEQKTGYGDDDIPFIRSDLSDSMAFDDRSRSDMRA